MYVRYTSHRLTIWIGLIVSLFVPAFSHAQDPTWTDDSPAARELTALNRQLTAAYVQEDITTLRAMLDHAHVHNNVFGRALTKDQFLGDIESGVLEFETYKTRTIKWHISGDTAVATGTIFAKAIRDGRRVPANDFLFTRIFIRRPEGWKVLLFHNTMMPPTAEKVDR